MRVSYPRLITELSFNLIFTHLEVKLETFLNFNKIRNLTEDVKEIAKALKFSSQLRLSEDGTTVSRITSFQPKSQEEVDNCTIYVVSNLLIYPKAL